MNAAIVTVPGRESYTVLQLKQEMTDPYAIESIKDAFAKGKNH